MTRQESLNIIRELCDTEEQKEAFQIIKQVIETMQGLYFPECSTCWCFATESCTAFRDEKLARVSQEENDNFCPEYLD